MSDETQEVKVEEIHPTLKLVLARMESHPEEFKNGTRKWQQHIESVRQFMTPHEKAVLKAKERELAFDNLHAIMAKEILDPRWIKR